MADQEALRARAKANRAARPWSKHLPDGPFDALVIGSGMGGMTTAACLAKLGKRVLVLEQHYLPGGFTHTFTRKGYTWDVGVHAVGEVTHHSLTGRLLAKLTDGRLQWTSLGEVYDRFHLPDGSVVGFPDTPEGLRDALVEAVPGSEEVVREYLEEVRLVARNMRGYYLARLAPAWAGSVAELALARNARGSFSQTVTDVLDRLTQDPKLRLLLVAQWGYYGVKPSEASFAIQALVTKHFSHGAYYPVGGSQRIATELLETVRRAGGHTMIKADVAQILVEDGRAVGVRLADGREVRAPTVISAAGVVSTVTRMLPPDLREESWVQQVEPLPSAAAHVCLYLGFKGDIREAGASAANEWFYETLDLDADAWEVAPGDVDRCGVLYCSFPSLKDPEHDPGPEVRHTGEVVTFVPWERFAPWSGTPWRKRGADYEAFKEELKTTLLRQFFERMPALEPLLDYAELSTPLSTETFVRPMRGSIYGLQPTPDRFANKWLRPRSPVPGLFFSGSEVATVGVIGAMMGGVLAAGAAEPRAMWKLLGEVR